MKPINKIKGNHKHNAYKFTQMSPPHTLVPCILTARKRILFGQVTGEGIILVFLKMN